MITATRTAKPSTETLTRRDASGSIYALSSNGVTEYRIDLAAQTCSCKGFAYRRTCRHLAAAQQRYDTRKPCVVCGYLTTGIDYRRIGGGRDLELALCHFGEGHCAE